MPQSFSRILVHLIFSTKNRSPWIIPEIRDDLYKYLAGALKGHDCTPIKIGGVADHVHLFFGLSRTHSIAEIVEAVKVASSKWIKTKGSQFADFHWQNGYGAFSIGQSGTDDLVRYIDRQEEHHRVISFQDEYRDFLARYQVEYDERYVWD